jgi:hypothetical protein
VPGLSGAVTVLEERLAWDLVDRHADCLADHQRHEVFVSLGTGDYAPAIRGVLTALLHRGHVLPSESVTLLRAWMISYDRSSEFGALLDRVSGNHHGSDRA